MFVVGRIIETEAETLIAARCEVQKQLAAGEVVIREWVVDNGSPRPEYANAATVEAAVREAKAKLPANAVIEKEEVDQQPLRDIVNVKARNEEDARRLPRLTYHQTIESVALVQPGGRGFLGIGRRANTYAVAITQPARITVTYRPFAKVKADVAIPDQYKSGAMKSIFWENEGPIRREELYEAQRSALLGLTASARAGETVAAAEIKAILERATHYLLDVDEFSRYHGYQRQQVAAEILGIAGTHECVGTLEAGRQLQDRYAGCSQYSNTTSTQGLVQDAIDAALTRIRTLEKS